MLFGCTQTTQEPTKDISAFDYNEEAFPDSKPWTSQNFKNNSENFQFVIIGDRTGGANSQGTFTLAMNQINLLQPEFIINVGGVIEGYSENKDALNAEWDEMDQWINTLNMPLFRTPDNHDIAIRFSVVSERLLHASNFG